MSSGYMQKLLRIERLLKGQPYCLSSNKEIQEVLGCGKNALSDFFREAEQDGWFTRVAVPSSGGTACTGRVGIIVHKRATDRPVVPRDPESIRRISALLGDIKKRRGRTVPYPSVSRDDASINGEIATPREGSDSPEIYPVTGDRATPREGSALPHERVARYPTTGEQPTLCIGSPAREDLEEIEESSSNSHAREGRKSDDDDLSILSEENANTPLEAPVSAQATHGPQSPASPAPAKAVAVSGASVPPRTSDSRPVVDRGTDEHNGTSISQPRGLPGNPAPAKVQDPAPKAVIPAEIIAEIRRLLGDVVADEVNRNEADVFACCKGKLEVLVPAARATKAMKKVSRPYGYWKTVVGNYATGGVPSEFAIKAPAKPEITYWKASDHPRPANNEEIKKAGIALIRAAVKEQQEAKARELASTGPDKPISDRKPGMNLDWLDADPDDPILGPEIPKQLRSLHVAEVRKETA